MRALFSLLLLTAIISPLASQNHPSAQKPSLSPSRIREVVVLGSKRYKPAELVAATGLKIGEEGSEVRLKAAAQQLADTGMFSSVNFSWEGGPQGIRAEFKVEDQSEFYRPIFDNFVWMPEDELLRELQKRRPLFRGEVPAAGETFQELCRDVQAILDERHIAGTVEVHIGAGTNGGPVNGFVYTVTGVPIPIRAIEFPGASPEMAEALKHVAAGKVGSDYTAYGVAAFARLDVLPEIESHGYLRAKVGSPEFTLDPGASNSVVVRIPLEQGPLYTLKDVQWSGASALPAAELTKLVKLPIGKPADMTHLDEGLHAIRVAYMTRGYMRSNVKVSRVFDDREHTLTCNMQVTEGDQFHMGALSVEGAGEEVARQFAKVWKLKTGDVFDGMYAATFVTELGRHFDLHALNVTVEEKTNAESKSIDVVLHVAKRRVAP